ncbi:MAG: asparagine synthase [Candidatus Latescibacteria bacterium]|nr:asparagine synthase [Candidatus Latescibacterota bacterium]
MSYGIAGVFSLNQVELVQQMLKKIKHRGEFGKELFQTRNATIGIVFSNLQSHILKTTASDYNDKLQPALIQENKLVLRRDLLGIVPLYYGKTRDHTVCFASEVKALLDLAQDINEFLPGYIYQDNQFVQKESYQKQPGFIQLPETIAQELRMILCNEIQNKISENETGAWLSGGLDSSAIVSLASKYVKTMHTFAAGLKDAPDIKFARIAADYIKTRAKPDQKLHHHEIIVGFKDMLKTLPDVVYSLESFDALLVRSSITNYLAAKRASQYVSQVFSGEAGDELFAGYEYLKTFNPLFLADELVDIMNRLHNTALQRVDRCASAFGLTAYVPFASPEIINYALQIPAEYKLYNGIEKWILRRALDGFLPDAILNRTKAKFWQGAGIGELFSQYADKHISDADFRKESVLPCAWKLHSKEELMYYRIFKDHFGELENLDWMGRTKPTSPV